MMFIIYLLNAEFQRIARRNKKGFLSDQCKEIEESNRMGNTRDLFLEKAMTTHSSTLAWKIPWMEGWMVRGKEGRMMELHGK